MEAFESHRVDARLSGPAGPLLIEVRQTNSIRDVRDGLTALAFVLRAEPDTTQALCVVVTSRLSEARISAELGMFRDILHPGLAARLHCLPATSKGKLQTPLPAVATSLRADVEEVVERETSQRQKTALPARQAVLVALVDDLLAGLATRRSLRDLQRAAAVSYPTASAAVAELSQRGLLDDVPGSRGARLRPLSATELLDLAREHASQRRVRFYVDPTGLLTPQRLAERFRQLRVNGVMDASVRIGGVLGAFHHFPPLDLTGAPRLDLSVGDGDPDISALDAGLIDMPAGAAGQPAVLAVHRTIHVGGSLTPQVASSLDWASPFECLADLVELGFSREALEMATSLMSRPP